MTMERTGLELVAVNKAKFVADIGQADKTVNIFINNLNEAAGKVNNLGSETDKAGGKVKSFGKTVLAVARDFFFLTNAVQTTVSAVENTWSALEEGAGKLEIADAFATEVSSAGQSVTEFRETLDEAASHTITDTNLMAAANRAMALKVSHDMNELANLMEIARFKARKFGKDTTEAFDDLATGIGRKSRPLLDNLGIVLDMNRVYAEYAHSMGIAVSEMSAEVRTQAILNKVLQEGNEEIRRAGGLHDTTADILRQQRTAIIEAKDAWIQYFAASAALPAVGSDKGDTSIAGKIGAAADTASKWIVISRALTAGVNSVVESGGMVATEMDTWSINYNVWNGNMEAARATLAKYPGALEAFNAELDRSAKAYGFVAAQAVAFDSAAIASSGSMKNMENRLLYLSTESGTLADVTHLLDIAFSEAAGGGATKMLEKLKEGTEEADRHALAYRRAESAIASMIEQESKLRALYPESFGKNQIQDVGMARRRSPGGDTSAAGGGDWQTAQEANLQDALRRTQEEIRKKKEIEEAWKRGATQVLEVLRKQTTAEEKLTDVYRVRESQLGRLIQLGEQVKQSYPEYFGKGSQPDVGLARFGMPGGDTSRAGGGDIDEARKTNAEDAARRVEEAMQRQKDMYSRLIDLERSTADELLDIHQDRIKKLADADRDAGERRVAAEAEYNKQLLDLAQDYAEDVADAREKFARDSDKALRRFLLRESEYGMDKKEDSGRNAARDLAQDAKDEEDYRIESLRAWEDYQKRLRDIQRDGQASITDAIRRRNGIDLRNALEAMKRNLENATEDYELQAKRRKEDYERKREERRKEREREQREAEDAERKDRERRLRAFQEEQKERKEAFDQEQADLRNNYLKKVQELQREHTEELQAIQSNLVKQKQEIERAHVEQLQAARAAYARRLADLQEAFRLEQMTTAQALHYLATQHYNYLNYLRTLYQAASFGVNTQGGGTSTTPATNTSIQSVTPTGGGQNTGTSVARPSTRISSYSVGNIIVSNPASGVTTKDLEVAVYEGIRKYDYEVGRSWQ